MRLVVPELGLVSAELHVGSEGAQVKSRLSDSQWSLFVVDGLLESHDVPLLSPNLLQDLHTPSINIQKKKINQLATLSAVVEFNEVE